MDPSSPTGGGRIVTFYSYKGGAGRSMALANVAWVLACARKRVLVIDWDLEAPGLHRYFAPFLVDKKLQETEGVIDFIWNFATEAMNPAHGLEDALWYEPLADLPRFAVSLDYPFPPPGSLDFIAAGRQDASYAKRVGLFDWKKFYEDMGGGVFIEAARRRMREQYDYVLIDSRTGVSDTSGICTVQMPDALVACFTANNQSIAGTAAVVASVRAQWAADPDRQGAAARIYPLLTRVDGFERDKLARRRDLARAEFLEFLGPGEVRSRDGQRGAAELPYIPVYSYEETLAAFGDTPGGQEAVLMPSIERLTALITEGRVSRLEVRPEEWKRRKVLAQFEGTEEATIEIARKEVAGRRFDVFLSYSRADQPAVEELARRLKQEGIEPWLAKWQLIPGEQWQSRIDEALAASASAAVFIGPRGLGEWQHEELRAALNRRDSDGVGIFRIIPVLLPGADRPRDLGLPRYLMATTWVEFQKTLDEPETFGRLVRGIRGTEAQDIGASLEGECPYRGLQPFDADHAQFFFGREALTETLLAAIRPAPPPQNRFLAIIGPSGSGKSSLAFAGLLPALRAGRLEGSESWLIAVFRPGPNPLEALAVALSRLGGGSPDLARLRDLESRFAACEQALHFVVRDLLKNAPPGQRVVVLVDQFEEVFTLCDSEQARDALIRNLTYAASAADGQAIIALTMRADFFSKCLAYPGLVAALPDHQVLVGPLSKDELRRAIERPAQLVGCEIEPGLVELLLNDVMREAGALPLLQYTLLDLWQRRAGRRLTLESYQSPGGLSAALERQGNAVLRELNPRERELCRRIFLQLISVGDGTVATRRRVSIAELGATSSAAGDVERIVQKLVDARLLTTKQGESAAGEPVVEIAHEALIEGWMVLREWIDADREFLRIRTRIALASARWRQEGRPADFLLAQGKPLSEALELMTRRRADLDAEVVEFVEKSLKHWQRKRRLRAGVALAVAAAFLVVSATFGAYSFLLRRRAEAALAAEKKAKAEAQANFAKARQSVNDYLALVSKNVDLSQDVPGLQKFRAQLLGKALGYYQDFLEQHAKDPTLGAEVAEAYSQVGLITDELGKKQDALAAYEKARRLFVALCRANPGNAQLQNDLARTYNSLGILEAGFAMTELAEDSYRQALEILARLATANPANPQHQNELASAYNNLGRLQFALLRVDSGTQSFTKAQEILEKLVAQSPSNTQFQSDRARTYVNLGDLERAIELYPDSEKRYGRALAILEKLVAQDPDAARLQGDLANAYNGLGAVQVLMGRSADAEQTYGKALAILKHLVEVYPYATKFRNDLAQAYNNLGTLQRIAGRLEDSELSDNTAREILEKLVAQNPSFTTFRNDLAFTYTNLGVVQRLMGKYADAEHSHKQALMILQAVVAEYPRSSESQEYLAFVYDNLGKLQAVMGRPADSQHSYNLERAIREKLAEQYPGSVQSQRSLAGVYNSLAWLWATSWDPKYRDGKKAVELATRACELTQWKDAVILDTLSASSAEVGDFEAAVKWATKAVEMAEGEDKAEIRSHLERFQEKKPFREPAPK